MCTLCDCVEVQMIRVVRLPQQQIGRSSGIFREQQKLWFKCDISAGSYLIGEKLACLFPVVCMYIYISCDHVAVLIRYLEL